MKNVAQKLLMKAGQHWLLYNAPENYLAVLEPLPNNLQLSYNPEGVFDGIHLFVRNSAELTESIEQLHSLFAPNTMLWIIYPKKSSGITTDLEMMSSWDPLAAYGLGGVAAAAIDNTWTALRFKPKELTKTSATRNSEIANNEFATFINIADKTIILPANIETLLVNNPLAYSNFSKLSYSNKKEYVLWILTAKQEKTRTDRLEKMLEKLLNGKKNPSEK